MIEPDKRVCPERERPQRVLVVNPRGLALHKPGIGRDLWSLRWSDIEEIVAIKIDRPATDLVCLGLKSEHESDYRIFDREMPGWNDVVNELGKRFDSTIGGRLGDIEDPLLAENFTVLWSRIIRGEFSEG
jgi:hypothetical protein